MYWFVLVAFLISAILIPFVIKFCKKHEVYDRIDSRKVHTGQIPRLGSIGFVTGFTVSTLLYLFIYGDENWIKFIPLIVSGLIIFICGIVDDLKDMKARVKLVFQCLAAIVMVVSGYRFRNIWGWEIGWIGYPLTFCWIVGSINSFNLIDGVDALCGGLSTFILLTVSFVCMHTNQLVHIVCLILAGAVLGFLLYNKPKAKIFMGDGGSQFLGFMISIIPLFDTTKGIESEKFGYIVLLSAIPIFDTIAAVWRRKREGRSFFSPDKCHLHHKLMNMGYRTPGILMILYFFQIVLCVVVIIANHIGGIRGRVIIGLGFFVATLFFTVIHFTNRAVQRTKTPDFQNEINEH